MSNTSRLSLEPDAPSGENVPLRATVTVLGLYQMHIPRYRKLKFTEGEHISSATLWEARQYACIDRCLPLLQMMVKALLLFSCSVVSNSLRPHGL